MQKPPKPPKVNYLSNPILMQEIHKSKKTYCYFVEPKYGNYDCIITTLSDITPELIEEVKTDKADKELARLRKQARLDGHSNTSSHFRSITVDPNAYQLCDVVFRLPTDEHIPIDPDKLLRGVPQKASTNFPAFKHYIVDESLEPIEVGRSHWRDALHNGTFSTDHGQLSRGLAQAIQLIVKRYAGKGNWRGYSYNDSMQCEATCVLVEKVLKFNEARGDNPFSYMTVICTNAFTRVLNDEKRIQNTRDDLLESAGHAPSSTRQISNEKGKYGFGSGPVMPVKSLKAGTLGN